MSAVITPFEGTELFNTASFNNRISQINTGFSYISNPNLLDNWYFWNPVDQRGGNLVLHGIMAYRDAGCTIEAGGVIEPAIPVYKVSDQVYAFTGGDKNTYYVKAADVVRGYIPAWNGYSIDRWNVESDSEVVITLINGGIRVKNTANVERQFKQILPIDLNLAGMMITISALVGAVIGSANYLLTQVNDPYKNSATCSISTNGLFSSSGSVLTGQQKIVFTLAPGAEITLLAAKLELGSTQTLAHLEGDKWVLNEIPDYGEQLRRCQRYFVNFNPYKMKYFGMPPGVSSNSTMVFSNVTLPVAMRAQPVVSYGGTIYASQQGNITVTRIDVTNDTFNGISVQLKYTVDGGLTANSMYRIQGGKDTSSYIHLSADL